MKESYNHSLNIVHHEGIEMSEEMNVFYPWQRVRVCSKLTNGFLRVCSFHIFLSPFLLALENKSFFTASSSANNSQILAPRIQGQLKLSFKNISRYSILN